MTNQAHNLMNVYYGQSYEYPPEALLASHPGTSVDDPPPPLPPPPAPSSSSTSSRRHRSPGGGKHRKGNPDIHNQYHTRRHQKVFADPAEMVVIDYVDSGAPSTRGASIASSTPKPPVYRHPPPQPVASPTSGKYSPSTGPPRSQEKIIVMPPSRQNINFQQELPPRQKPVNLHQDMHASGEFAIAGRVYQGQQYHHQFHQHLENSVHTHPANATMIYHGAHQLPPDHPYFHQQSHVHHPEMYHQNSQSHVQQFSKTSNRSSRSSDTSSAYSGSDTMQSMQSSLENEPVDLSGLHESVVDSDEDITESMDSLAIRDVVRDCLEKDPADRTPEDIEVLLEFTQTLPAFCNMTLATRKALCGVMVFAVVEKAGTIVMNDGEELDSWSVIINGEVRIDKEGSATRFLKWGDSFGITPTMEKLYHNGVMKTCQDDCQFVCITQTDYYKILNEELTNQRRYEENGKTVLVTEPDPTGKVGHKVIRGTKDQLLSQLIDENSNSPESTFVEDFLLTHRTFMESSWKVADKLLEWFNEGRLCDRVTRVLILWTYNHFTDFEMDPYMMEFLEKFETALDGKNMSGQLRMLNFTCSEKARQRTITLTRSSREEPLNFSLMGGYERGFGIFVDRVEKNSKAAEIGLKRGDQILEVNRQSFEHNMKLERALTFLKESTHLEMSVKSNLLGIGDEEKYKAPIEVLRVKKSKRTSFKMHYLMFKEMLQMPKNLQKAKNASQKLSDLTGLRPNNQENDVSGGKKNSQNQKPEETAALKSSKSSSSILPLNAMSGKDKVKAVLKGLIRPKQYPPMLNPDIDPTLAPTGSSGSSGGVGDLCDLPEHSLKIYRIDQHFRYLLVHQYTTARNVVMLALQEFGISECSTNFTLCEVTVEGGFVRQKRLPDDQTNLAERIGLCSRYYIKNIMNSEQLIPDEAMNELTKESIVNLLQLSPIEVAMQLMVEDFTIFRMIEPTEYIDQLFEINSKFGTPNLTRFGELVNTEMFWVVTEIVSESNVNRRAKIIKQFIKIAYHCFKDTQNYNTMFAITSGLDHGSVKRLKSTWEKVPQKYTKLLGEMQVVMDPSMNFRKYRSLISNSKPPFIPIYPMVSKDLTFIHLGNETMIEGLVNFEKLRMLAKEIRLLTNMCSASLDFLTMLERQSSDVLDAMRRINKHNPSSTSINGATMKRGTVMNLKKAKEALNPKKMYEEAQMVRRVKAYLSKMPVIKDEDTLQKMSMEVEPPPPGSSSSLSVQKTLTGQSSSASLRSSGNKSQRGHSPSPSVGSTASGTSHQSTTSDGKKSQASASKFGAESPEAVRKLMSLSEQTKKVRKPVQLVQQPKLSISSIGSDLSSLSPGTTRKPASLDIPIGKVNLTKESSSVTSLPHLRKSHTSTSSVGSLEDFVRNEDKAKIDGDGSTHRIPKAKLGGRTLSRERKSKSSKNVEKTQK